MNKIIDLTSRILTALTNLELASNMSMKAKSNTKVIMKLEKVRLTQDK